MGDRKCIYLSSPIATGSNLAKFKSAGFTIEDHPEVFAQMVIYPNKARAKHITSVLRAQYPDEVFLNPAELGKIDEWTNDDYNNFWIEVIEDFAKENWLLPGWQYSVGCNLEKKTSEEIGLPIRYVYDDNNEVRVL